jgi:hypothetical protein
MAEEPCYRMVPERVDGVWLRWCAGYLAGHKGIARSLSAASLPTCQPAERLGAGGRAAPEASACSPQTCQSGQRVPRLAENVVVVVVLDRPAATLTGCVNI